MNLGERVPGNKSWVNVFLSIHKVEVERKQIKRRGQYKAGVPIRDVSMVSISVLFLL